MADRLTQSSPARTSADYAYPSQTPLEQEHTDNADNAPLLSRPQSLHTLQGGQHAVAASVGYTSPVLSQTKRPGSHGSGNPRHRHHHHHHSQEREHREHPWQAHEQHPYQYQSSPQTSQQQPSAPAPQPQAAPATQPLAPATPSPQPPQHPAQSSLPTAAQPSPLQALQFNAAARLELYRVLIGILPAPRVPTDPLSLEGPHIRHRFHNPFRRSHSSQQAPGSNHESLPLRAETNLGLYYRILRAEANAHVSYRFYATCINIAYLLGIALSATITAISAYSSSFGSPASIAITVMGAVNAAVTAVVAYLKSRGLPTRKLLYKNQLRRVREYAEWRERQFAIDAKLGIVGAATVEGAVNAQGLASLAIATPNITQGAAAGNDAYTPGGAASPSGGGGGGSGCHCHCGCAKCHCPGNKPAASSSSSVKSSKSGSVKSKGATEPPPAPPPDPNPLTPNLTAGGAILLDPQREAEIVEQMYWTARQDEEANYPETYAKGGSAAGGGSVAQTSGGSGFNSRNRLLADIAAKAGGIVTDAIPLAVMDWSHHHERQRVQYQHIAPQKPLQLAQAHFHYHPSGPAQTAMSTQPADDYQGQYRDGYGHGYGAPTADLPPQPPSDHFEKQPMQAPQSQAVQSLQSHLHQQQVYGPLPGDVYYYGYDGSHDPASPQHRSSSTTKRAPQSPPPHSAAPQPQAHTSTQHPASAHPTQPPRLHHHTQRIPAHSANTNTHRPAPPPAQDQPPIPSDVGGNVYYAPLRTLSGSGASARSRGAARKSQTEARLRESVMYEYV